MVTTVPTSFSKFERQSDKCSSSGILEVSHSNASPFVLHTDASDEGIGAVLEQDSRVVAYASRAITKTEMNYSVIQKDCLAVIFATEHSCHYLLGHLFKLFTDHQPLQWLSGQKMQGMLCRWTLTLQEYDFKIEYKPGSQNGNADALSQFDSDSTAEAGQCAATFLKSHPPTVESVR